MSILGNRVLRKEDPKFLTVGGTYTADVRDPRLDGALHVTYVRATMAHARVLSIETEDAQAMPGVVAVFTAADLDGPTELPGSIPMFPPPMMNRPLLNNGTVRFVGEPVAVIVTERPEQGEDAAEAVLVDYEPLPAVVDMEASATDQTVVFDEVGTNVAVDMTAFGMCTGVTDDAFFDGCDVVVRQRIVNNRTAAAPLEVRSTAVAWEGDRLVMWISNQGPHGVKGALAGLYGLEPDQVHLIVPDVGGGFGAKISAYPEDVLLPWIAKRLGRPVRWLENRTENMNAMGPGRAQVQQVAIGGTRDGVVKAYRIEVVGDAGAYARLGAFLPFFTHQMAPGVYAFPKVETSAKAVITNTTPTEAYRGAGRPEATAAVERAMDLFAAEIGMDPAEVRRANLIPADAFPYTTAVGTVYDSGDYEKALDIVLEQADYAGLRAEQQRRRDAGDVKQLGLGLSVYVEVTAGPAPGGAEFARVEITPEGRAKVFSGALSHGQSHATTFAMIAADQLGMSIDDVEIIQGDTDLVPTGVGTFGSRSTQLGGSSIHVASGQVVDQARRVAATLLEAAADDVVLDKERGAFHVAGAPAVVKTWAEVAAAADGSADGGLAAEQNEKFNCSYPFGAHLAVVEVDTETGGVRLVRMITCDDSGIIINPVIVEGQRHGGIAQGVAQALLEEVRYDADGNPQTGNFADYGIISMAELPSYELYPLETPSPNNPLGVKGIGESGAIGATPAVQNAVVDALAHLGVRHVDIPCTAERVWSAIHGAR
jgi:aerobic carbon-monoxide dehydrogenase large subunit